jgi:hypothetical protein
MATWKLSNWCLAGGSPQLTQDTRIGMLRSIIANARSGHSTKVSLLSQFIGHCTKALIACALFAFSSGPTLAQTAPATIPPGPLPTDITPIRINESKQLFEPGPSLYLFQKLPSRFWFNFSGEVNQRYETNVFLTQHGHSGAYVFRTYPNITAGWNLFGNTSIYTNYFMIKDVYSGSQHHALTAPTTQSLGYGLRNVHQFDRKTSLQTDFLVRELWQQRGLRQADMIPGALLTRVLNPHSIVFLNLQLQLRGHTQYEVNREIDPFYTIGFVFQKGPWQFSAVDTFITNFRNPPFVGSVPMHGNVAMIADFEINRQITHKIPGMVAFLRAEPIWNWHSGGTPSISGFDFRLYSGIRLTFVKPSYASTMNQLKDELKRASGNPQSETPPLTTNPSSPNPNSPANPAPGNPTAPNSSLEPGTPSGDVIPATSVIPGAVKMQEVSLDSASSSPPTVPDELLPLRTPMSPGGLMY